MVRTGDKPWFGDWCVLAHYAKGRAYRVWSRNGMQADWKEIGWLVDVLSWSIRRRWASIHETEQITLDECTKSTEVMVNRDDDGLWRELQFPLFYKQIAWELARKLAVIFRQLAKGGNFPACWMLADVDLVPKGSPALVVCDYRPISVIPFCQRYLRRSLLRS